MTHHDIALVLGAVGGVLAVIELATTGLRSILGWSCLAVAIALVVLVA